MPGGAELISRLLGASAPEQTNPAFGLHETTPQMLLDHLNDTLQKDPTFAGSAYQTIDQANQDGYNIPTSSIYHDATGNQVTDPDVISKAQDVGSYGTKNPMKTPGFWQRFANPQGAERETAINTQFQTNPEFAQQGEDVRKQLISNRIKAMPSSQKIMPYMTDDELSNTGVTGLEGPSDFARQTRSLLGTQRGLTGTQVGADVANANTMLTSATRELQRQPVEQSTLDANAVNALHTATGVDPVRIELAHQQLVNELHREPKQEEIRELLLKEQKSRALVGGGLAATQASNLPTLQNTEEQNIRNSAYEATHPPTAGSPFYRGSSGLPALNPSYIGSIPQMNAKLGTGSVSGGGHIPLGNGLNIVPSTTAPTVPSTARPLRVEPVPLSTPAPTNAPLQTVVQPTASDTNRPVAHSIGSKDATIPAWNQELWKGGPSLQQLLRELAMRTQGR